MPVYYPALWVTVRWIGIFGVSKAPFPCCGVLHTPIFHLLCSALLIRDLQMEVLGSSQPPHGVHISPHGREKNFCQGSLLQVWSFPLGRHRIFPSPLLLSYNPSPPHVQNVPPPRQSPLALNCGTYKCTLRFCWLGKEC